MARAKRSPKQLHLEGLSPIHPNAADIDIRANEIVVAVPPFNGTDPCISTDQYH